MCKENSNAVEFSRVGSEPNDDRTLSGAWANRGHKLLTAATTVAAVASGLTVGLVSSAAAAPGGHDTHTDPEPSTSSGNTSTSIEKSGGDERLAEAAEVARQNQAQVTFEVAATSSVQVPSVPVEAAPIEEAATSVPESVGQARVGDTVDSSYGQDPHAQVPHESVPGTIFAGVAPPPPMPPARIRHNITFDAFGNEYETTSEAQSAEVVQLTQALVGNLGLGDGSGETDLSVTGAPGVHIHNGTTVVLGTQTGVEEIVINAEQSQVSIGSQRLHLGSVPGHELVIVGNGGTDVIQGSDKAEIIVGGNERDIVIARGGDDKIYTGSGNDDIFPGAGSDTAYSGDGADVIDELAGNDEGFSFFPGEDDLYGGEGNDILRGGAGKDYLYGGSGNDHIEGNNGRDTAVGGPGDDVVYGGRGKDTLNGDGGNDYLDGGRDNDTVSGHDGNDIVIGGLGNDKLDSGAGTDTYVATLGTDKILGRTVGIDTLYARYSDSQDKSVIAVVVDPDLAADQISTPNASDDFVDRVESDLMTLRSLPTGQATLAKIENSDQGVTLLELSDPRSASGISFHGPTGFINSATEEPGKGSGTTLYYGTGTLNDFDSILPVVELGHELIHGALIGDGLADSGVSTEVDKDGNVLIDPNTGQQIFSPDFELSVVGLRYVPGFDRAFTDSPLELQPNRLEITENLLRADLGLSPRQNYQAFQLTDEELRSRSFPETEQGSADVGQSKQTGEVNGYYGSIVSQGEASGVEATGGLGGLDTNSDDRSSGHYDETLVGADPKCSDPDGDGWGWTGSQSCLMAVASAEGATCVDTNGDQWGWTGTESCWMPSGHNEQLTNGSN